MHVIRTGSNYIGSVLFALICHSTLFAGSPAGLLNNNFKSVDSALSVFTRSVRPSKSDSATIGRSLASLLRQNPGLSAVALADTRGDIVAFAGYEARNNELLQNVSRRDWYAVPRKTRQPYYGPLTEINHRFYCLWSRPVLAPSALGLTACEGVFLAYVNVAECFKNFSRGNRCPYEMAHNNAVFYHTDNWQESLPFAEEQFSLKGGVDFTLRYTTAMLKDTVRTDSLASKVGATTIGTIAALPDSIPIAPEPQRTHGAMVVGIVIGIIGLAAAGVFFMIRRKRVNAGARKETNAGSGNTEEEKDAVDDERLRLELKEKVRAELREEIRRQMVTTENAALREEARGKLLEEHVERLRKEVGGNLEMEALQALTRTVHSEVRDEHAAQLRERALKELDERVRREVAVRERSMLVANARESLKAEIEKELRETEWTVLRREARAIALADLCKEPDAVAPDDSGTVVRFPDSGSTPGTVREAVESIRAALRTIDESEALSSLAKTVDLLKSSQRESPYFNLNAAQTSSMVEYLVGVSGRLQGYVTDVKAGIGCLYRSVERLLREKEPPAPDEAGPPEQEQFETVAAETTETLVKSE